MKKQENAQGISGIFSVPKPLVGVIHLPALPGSPRAALSLPDITARAVSDAHTLIENGINGVIVENYGDIPFLPRRVEPHTVAAMTLIVADVRRIAEQAGLPVGVNVLRNDAQSAIAIATVTGASFIRVNVHIGAMVTDQGVIEGQAYDTLRYRAQLQNNVIARSVGDEAIPKQSVKILSDVLVKHATSLGAVDLATVAQDTYYRGLSDALIVTGTTTGAVTSIDDVQRVQAVVPEAAVFVGSGVTAENIEKVLRYADGVIIGTALKEDGRTENPVDASRVRQIVELRRRFLQHW